MSQILVRTLKREENGKNGESWGHCMTVLQGWRPIFGKSSLCLTFRLTESYRRRTESAAWCAHARHLYDTCPTSVLQRLRTALTGRSSARRSMEAMALEGRFRLFRHFWGNLEGGRCGIWCKTRDQMGGNAAMTLWIQLIRGWESWDGVKQMFARKPRGGHRSGWRFLCEATMQMEAVIIDAA
jgi:hypothetical protein